MKHIFENEDTEIAFKFIYDDDDLYQQAISAYDSESLERYITNKLHEEGILININKVNWLELWEAISEQE